MSNQTPCPGCDGHECDDGCQYPGVVTPKPRPQSGDPEASMTDTPKGILSSDNPYSHRDEIEKWLAWDTTWHKLALEVARLRKTANQSRRGE
jgi:hypothetical protein